MDLFVMKILGTDKIY